MWLSRFETEAEPQGQGGKWRWQGGAGRKGGSQKPARGAESQFSVVEFRVVRAGFGVSLPGNGWIPAGGVGAELKQVFLGLNPCPSYASG